MHFTLTSVAVHWCWVSAHLHEQLKLSSAAAASASDPSCLTLQSSKAAYRSLPFEPAQGGTAFNTTCAIAAGCYPSLPATAVLDSLSSTNTCLYMLGFIETPPCKTNHFCQYKVRSAPAKPHHACPSTHMGSFGQPASGGQAEPCGALLGMCTAAQPALLADQTLWKPDPTYVHFCGETA